MNQTPKTPIPRVMGAELPLEAAEAGVSAAMECARQSDLQVSVAVVDAGGHLLSFSRVAGTPWSSIELAQGKSRTAVSFGMPSNTLGNMIDAATDRVRLHLLLRPDIIAMGGAFPVQAHGRVIGAIGVSGASEEQDIECAEAGLAAIHRLIESAL
ncbi:heme-binding protein [Marinobacter pelagius]|uniref:GlcG/HbpS family heme-binding protein n=1 Tax=Marinobacter sp. C7 TaxID=2951363 RepID=UPI001EF143AB|nr:heme-binding protein [Marinobacter sp. C7]MCG7200254.1 heme-binding protein [Marinobacter sp. C7]